MDKVKKEHKELLSILDEILNYLVNNTDNYEVNFFKMSDDAFNLKRKEVESKKSTAFDAENLITEIFRTFDEPFNKINDLRLATIYLHNRGLVHINSNHDIRITFEGLLAYSEGVVNKWDLGLSTSQRLQTLAEDNTLYQGRLTDATEEMNQTNQRIRSLTFWIMIAALVAIVYQVVEILKLFFPYWFCNIH